ncbi:hypothetical protein TNCV_3865371 [Trichonephila clavipes]|nr:hypothetical protein TNCV_3865371 [Trichonephila clavipes]
MQTPFRSVACPLYCVTCRKWHACQWFAHPDLHTLEVCRFASESPCISSAHRNVSRGYFATVIFDNCEISNTSDKKHTPHVGFSSHFAAYGTDFIEKKFAVLCNKTAFLRLERFLIHQKTGNHDNHLLLCVTHAVG